MQCFDCIGEGSAVLVRAAEPLDGHETMQLYRTSGKKSNEKQTRKRLQHHELANGPSKLCIALYISRDNCNKIDMTSSPDLWIEKSKDLRFRDRAFEVVEDKRIDSTPPEARNKLWRYFVKDSMSESRAKVGEIKKRQKLSQETITT